MRMSVGRVARLRWAAGPGGFVRSLKSTRKERNLDKNFNFELGADLGPCGFRVLFVCFRDLKREECDVD
jgi:hypothetical protein